MAGLNNVSFAPWTASEGSNTVRYLLTITIVMMMGPVGDGGDDKEYDDDDDDKTNRGMEISL